MSIELVETSSPHSLQLLMQPGKSLSIRPRVIGGYSEGLQLAKRPFLDRFATLSAQKMGFLLLSSSKRLKALRVDKETVDWLNYMEVEEDAIVGYSGFELKRNFKRTGKVVLKRTEELKLGFKMRTEENGLRRPVMITEETGPRESFIILETDHDLILKNLGPGETLNVRPRCIVMQNMASVDKFPANMEVVLFKEYTGPGLIAIDPLRAANDRRFARKEEATMSKVGVLLFLLLISGSVLRIFFLDMWGNG